MKSDSLKLGLVSFVAVVAITVMAFLSSFNMEGYYGYAARQKGTIGTNPGLSFEAESGIISGFITIEDPKASGKIAIYSPNGSGNASYQVNIERDGLYRVAVKTSTPLSYSPDNYLYVELNGQRVLLNVERSNNYKWVISKNHTGWVLKKGQRTVNIQSLSPDIRIDAVSLSFVSNECQDNDGDGYGRPGSELCTYPQNDCNDLDANINPGATELCNGKDDNCNRNIDEGCPGACIDNDNDGYGTNCANGNDCDDTNSNVFEFKSCKYNGNICGEFVLCTNQCPTPPQEICNNKIDDNCNGFVDEDCTQVLFSTNTIIEAENGILNGFLISNGYVYSPSDSSNSVSYTFNVVKSGEYVIYTKLISPDASTNSFYVSLNEGNVQGNEAYTYDTKTGQGIVEDYVRVRGPNGNITYAQYDPKIYTLNTGEYTLTFYGRERNTKLDALALMDASTYQINNTNTTVNNTNVTYQEKVFVSRSFSVNPVVVNGTVTVFLNNSGVGLLLIDEYVPAGVVIVDAGSGSNVSPNNVRFFDLNGGSKVFNYTVKVLSSGSFVFNGEYSLNGNTSNITGQKVLNTQFICSNGTNQSCTTGLYGACAYGIQTCINNNWGQCIGPSPQTEICNNNIDEDCDGNLNNGCSGFCDTDNDGHNQQLLVWCAIYGPIDDCNDNNPNIYTGAPEICGNGVDEDCNGQDLVCPNTPPIVSITNPVNGSVFNVGSNITIVALASDPNGSISKVEFYRNNILIGTDTTFPYSYTWNNAQAGNYNVYARAYDNTNLTTNSSAIFISVVQQEYCGNNVCGINESCSNCPQDCGVCSASVSRSFSVNPVVVNGTVTVFLNNSGVGLLLIDEYVPAGVVIVDAGSGSNVSPNNVRFFDLNGGSKVFNYTVKVLSSGSFVFNGEYSLNGNTSNITGQKVLNATTQQPPQTIITGTQLLGNRAIDWSPGIPGGIPYYNVSVNVMNYGAVGDGVADDTQAIKNAIAAAPARTAVYLPPGTYKTSSKININKAVVLRGAGVEQTKIICSNPTQHCITFEYGYDQRVYTPLISGYNKGSKQVTIANASNFQVGKYVEFRQDDDPSVYKNSDGSISTDRNTGQFNKIVGKNGNTLILEKPLYYDYNPSFNAGARPVNTMVEGAGIENFYIEIPPGFSDGSYGNIAFIGAANCWMKNIWSHYTYKGHVYMKESYANEIRDSVFQDTWFRGGGGHGYGIHHEARSTDNLYINNIFWKLRHAMILSWGATGNVFAYNYDEDPAAGDYSDQTQINTGWIYPDMSVHGHYPTMNLFEGNAAQNYVVDNVWGNNGPTTFFRNRVFRESQFVNNYSITRFYHISIDSLNPYQNIIANEIGKPGQQSIGYSGRWTANNSGTNSTILWVSLNVINTTLLHGNYEYLNNTYIGGWNPNLPQQLPASLFLTSKPDFFGSLDWPAFGPEKINSGNKIPAQIRFEQLRSQGKI